MSRPDLTAAKRKWKWSDEEAEAYWKLAGYVADSEKLTRSPGREFASDSTLWAAVKPAEVYKIADRLNREQRTLFFQELGTSKSPQDVVFKYSEREDTPEQKPPPPPAAPPIQPAPNAGTAVPDNKTATTVTAADSPPPPPPPAIPTVQQQADSAYSLKDLQASFPKNASPAQVTQAAAAFNSRTKAAEYSPGQSPTNKPVHSMYQRQAMIDILLDGKKNPEELKANLVAMSDVQLAEMVQKEQKVVQADALTGTYKLETEGAVAASNPETLQNWLKAAEQTEVLAPTTTPQRREAHRIFSSSSRDVFGSARQYAAGASSFIATAGSRYGIESEKIQSAPELHAAMRRAASMELLSGGLQGSDRKEALNRYSGMSDPELQKLMTEKGITGGQVNSMSWALAGAGKQLSEAGVEETETRKAARQLKKDVESVSSMEGLTSMLQQMGLKIKFDDTLKPLKPGKEDPAIGLRTSEMIRGTASKIRESDRPQTNKPPKDDVDPNIGQQPGVPPSPKPSPSGSTPSQETGQPAPNTPASSTEPPKDVGQAPTIRTSVPPTAQPGTPTSPDPNTGPAVTALRRDVQELTRRLQFTEETLARITYNVTLPGSPA